MRWPLDDFWISQGYTVGTHEANDLAANEGVKILSPEAGVVTAVNNNPASYFGGNYVKMRGDSGYVYYLGHNSKNHVTAGKRVTEGQHIADVGMTGEATGPHIHFQIESGGKLLDPSKVLAKNVTSKGEKIVDKKASFEFLANASQVILGRPIPVSREWYEKSAEKNMTEREVYDSWSNSDEAKEFRFKAWDYDRLSQQKVTVSSSEMNETAEKKLQTIKDALGIK